MFRIGDYERPVVNVRHCLEHSINTIQQNLLVRTAKELEKLIQEERAPQRATLTSDAPG